MWDITSRCAIMRRCICAWNREREGSGLVFATDCSEDVLDGNWQRLILTHLREKEHLGVLAGNADHGYEDHADSGKSALKAYGRRRLPAGDLPGGAPGD